MWVLGLNGRPVAYHDAAACLADGAGRVVACAEEERFTRVKHGLQTPPRNAAQFCLASAAVAPEDIDVVAIGWDVPRLRRAFGGHWDHASGVELLHELVGPELAGRMRARLEFVPHHLAHAAAAFGASGFSEAAVLIVDGQGEDTAISVFRADRAGGLRLVRSWSPRYSLGFLYEAATEWLGFGFLEAGKTMALAAFGRSGGPDADALIEVRDDDLVLSPALSDSLNTDDAESIAASWQHALTQLAGRAAPSATPAGLPDDPAAVRVAWAAQRTVQHAMVELAALARRATSTEALCVAGGVALNCVANGLLGEPVYVPPVPHDAGVALGAVWTVAPPTRGEPLRPDLGFPIPSVPGKALPFEALADEVLHAGSVQVCDLELPAVLDRLAAGEIGAIAEGRAEIGPRALGRRSIITLPRPASVADRLNRLKVREPWRPFGPAVLEGHGEHWWEQREHLARYMAGAVHMTEKGTAIAPAVRHVDGTTRPQLVRHAENPALLYQVLAAMEADGMPPVLVNTSFNRRGEPIVNSARHAVEAFLAMDLEFLLLGGLLVTKPVRR